MATTELDVSSLPRCMYCFEEATADPPSCHSECLLHLGCLCKGTMGVIHIQCKAKFAHLKTLSTNDLRSREYYWTHCEICSSNLKHEDGVMALARERHRLSTLQLSSVEGSTEEDEVRALIEHCMSVSFVATTIIKKFKQHDPYAGNATAFGEVGIELLRTTIEKIRSLPPSLHRVALLWALDMKFVDFLYFFNCMIFDKSTSLQDNVIIYFDGVQMARSLHIGYEHLYVSLLEMKKYFVDLSMKSDASTKRDANGKLVFGMKENKRFIDIKKRILCHMEEASNGGGYLAHFLAKQLNFQVEFVNSDTPRERI